MISHNSGSRCLVVVLGHFEAVHLDRVGVDGIGGLPGVKVCLRVHFCLDFVIVFGFGITNHWHQLVDHELITILVDEQVDLE